MSFAKGQTLPVHSVRCRNCGTPIQRKSYWRNPSCAKCSKARAREHDLGRLKKLRDEARRYRILMAANPYGSFQELLDAIRIRNPRSWAARCDLRNERRLGA